MVMDYNVDHLMVSPVRWCLVLVLLLERSDPHPCLLVQFTLADAVWWRRNCGIYPSFKTALGRVRSKGSPREHSE